jgi:hypothetical protein
MKHVFPVLAFACLIEILPLSASSLYGQASSECIPTNGQQFGAIQQEINKSKSMITQWRTQARYLMVLTLMVGTLGVAVGLLQRSDNRRCKGAMVAVGAAVSVITLINTTVFPADHRTFMRNVSQGRALINEIQDILCQFDPTQSLDNRTVTLEEIREKLKRIEALKDNLLTPPSLLQWAGLASHAYAQARIPSWVSKLPEDETSFFFLGVAESSSLTQAKESSSRDAMDKAVNQLSQSVPVRPEVLSEYVKDTAEVADTAFSYNRESRIYTYFTLLKLRQAFAKPEFIKVFTTEREIQAVLDTYKRAIEDKDITLFQSIFRQLAPTELRRLSESFAQANRQTVELTVEKIQVNGDEAEAKGRRKDVFVSREGKTTRDESDFVFKLKHTPQGWVIMAAK